ncbi:MAG: hypothetical protein IJ574_00830 [Bacilli bacterium]|nr:hypothetical protein [Bacilli bacterium]
MVKENIKANTGKWHTTRESEVFKSIMLQEENKELLKSIVEQVMKDKITDMTVYDGDLATEYIEYGLNDIVLNTNLGIIDVQVISNDSQRDRGISMAGFSKVIDNPESFGIDPDLIYETQYSIVILIYDMKDDNGNISDNICEDKAIMCYMLKDEDGIPYIDNFRIHVANMRYFQNLWYENNETEALKNKNLVMLDLPKEELIKFASLDTNVNDFLEQMNSYNEL